jgi:aspartyl-tRNA(Asn)/glutamyl-tRNA(Gln) amidotransferase subunit B
MIMLANDEINSRVAKDLLSDLFASDTGPRELATARNLLQISDVSALEPIIAEIISQHQSVVDEYKSGKLAAMQFLVGQAMKQTRGSANPELLRATFERCLTEEN